MMEETEYENKYKESPKIMIETKDYNYYFKEGKFIAKSAEEIQGLLYKYSKEYFLQLYLPNEREPIRIESILNKRKVDKYFKHDGGITIAGIDLVSDIHSKSQDANFYCNLKKIEIEFLLTELRPEDKNIFLLNLNKHRESVPIKTNKKKL